MEKSAADGIDRQEHENDTVSYHHCEELFTSNETNWIELERQIIND